MTAGIKQKGELRTQFHHVIDVAPTILEAAGLPEPKSVNGTSQTPIEGVSMLYTFNDAKTKSHHTTQYFEILSNRAIYKDGWLAGTVHRAPWQMKSNTTLADDKWELYDTSKDFSLSNDLAQKMPDKLKEMQALFTKEAINNNVLPIDDRVIERLNASLVGRPDIMAGRTSLTLHEGMTGISENVFINIKNHSFTIIAKAQIPDGGADGVLIAQAGKFGGWSFYLKKGKPTFTYNWLGQKQYTITSPSRVPAGTATIRFDFTYDGGLGKGGDGLISVSTADADQFAIARGDIDRTQGFCFSADEGTDVGCDLGTAVTNEYEVPFKFTGKIENITVEIKAPTAIDRAESDKANQEGTIKKALSN